ncbi:hypothetical protein ACFQZ4_08600 [Catellatospora coxensis]|uniref:Uncharacterized protein n=1 Tax=Catellatospora coxensis TaxID=310354 RepID=A0A8J3KTQ1_9ACTN|nr:hypothetical protein [Catellatospora coxensis]GIG08438.1 hypothetical protein Cco03nite_51380 [Catellatospora coxensis]
MSAAKAITLGLLALPLAAATTADPAGGYYRTVLDDLSPRLPQDVVDALPRKLRA